MLRLIILLAALSAFQVISSFDIMSDEYIDFLNSKQSSWKAGRNFNKNTPIHVIKRMVQKVKPKSTVNRTKYFAPVQNDSVKLLPISFDARKKWPECADLISTVPDQSACSGAWAVQTAAVITDRRCIASKGELKTPVSAEDLLSCCDICGYGCGGGNIDSAWDYWFTNGISTGGSYNSSQGCKPYSLEPCEHDTDGSNPQCADLSVTTPTCTKQCTSEENESSYEDELTFATELTKWLWNVEDIQREIMENGPVEAGFVVYSDFLHYKSGIYFYTHGDDMGAASAKIIGWGVESVTNMSYWLCINSWNEDWGYNGFFKIQRWNNTVGIEGEIYRSLPKLPSPPSTSTLPPSTSTLPPSTSTLPPSTSTLPPSTSTLPPSTSTLPPSTSTLPPSTSSPSPSSSSTLYYFHQQLSIGIGVVWLVNYILKNCEFF